MTIGQRVAQKRKEQGLSQEALGEALGVSRQSVYKWESDSALPEIDKLIAMSRLFGVTIGWLLGVEEPAQPETGREVPAPAPDGGGTDPGELTETQLKMVEEIVDRYLEARQPARRRWLWIAGGAAIGLALLLAFHSLRGEIQNMRSQYSSLQNAVNSVTWSVDTQISNIANRVEEVLKSQNSLTASYGVEIASADLAANTVTFSARATPKTYTEGMTAVFVADNGVEVVEVPASLGANQEFSARLTCGLTDGITVSVTFLTGDVREIQLLDDFYGLYLQSLPNVDFPDSNEMHWKEPDANGQLSWSTEDYAYLGNVAKPVTFGIAIEPAEAASIRVGLFRNQRLLCWLEPCERPDSYKGFNNSRFYRFPNFSVEPEEGDTFHLCTVVADEYGRELVYRGIPYIWEQDEGELCMAGGGEIGADAPENWEY